MQKPKKKNTTLHKLEVSIQIHSLPSRKSIRNYLNATNSTRKPRKIKKKDKTSRKKINTKKYFQTTKMHKSLLKPSPKRSENRQAERPPGRLLPQVRPTDSQEKDHQETSTSEAQGPVAMECLLKVFYGFF